VPSGDLGAELVGVAQRLREAAQDGDAPDVAGPLRHLRENAELVGRAWSGSPVGYHSRVYYAGFVPRPAGARFSVEWGFKEALSNETAGDWREYRAAHGRPLAWRHRVRQRLAHRPPMHPMTPRQRPDRQLLPREIAPYRLELLHSAHSFQPSAPRSTKRPASSSDRTEVGPVQTSTVGPVRMSTLSSDVSKPLKKK
jgi:hypothetical protein